MPAATAPELTMTSSFFAECKSANSRTSPRILDSSIPSREERIWLPTLTTTRRARRKISFLYSSAVMGRLGLLERSDSSADSLHQRLNAFGGCRGDHRERAITLRKFFCDNLGSLSSFG